MADQCAPKMSLLISPFIPLAGSTELGEISPVSQHPLLEGFLGPGTSSVPSQDILGFTKDLAKALSFCTLY